MHLLLLAGFYENPNVFGTVPPRAIDESFPRTGAGWLFNESSVIQALGCRVLLQTVQTAPANGSPDHLVRKMGEHVVPLFLVPSIGKLQVSNIIQPFPAGCVSFCVLRCTVVESFCTLVRALLYCGESLTVPW